MLSNRLAFAALAVACIAAAAGGGYLASRQNAVPAPAAAQVQPVTAPATTPAPAAPAALAERPVQETEAVVAEPKAPVKSEAPKIATPKRAEKTSPRSAATRQQPPPLASTWPSSAAGSPSPVANAPAPTTPVEPPAAPKPDEHVAQTPPPAPEPPQKQFEELVVSRDSVIGLQTENRISSETARVEDRVEARVTRDVKVADRVAIPAGARAIGAVTLVERGGKFKERARLGIRFHTLVLADGTRIPMNTETIFREGDAPGNSTAAKIGGGAVGGAIIGAILGGAKGAAIGATTGAGAGTAAVAAGDRSTVVLQPGTPLTVRVQQPVTVTVEKE
jgi:hypothetical protein